MLLSVAFGLATRSAPQLNVAVSGSTVSGMVLWISTAPGAVQSFVGLPPSTRKAAASSFMRHARSQNFDRHPYEAHSLIFGAVSITLVVKESEASKAFPRRMFRLSDVAMDSEHLLPISQLERAHFRDSDVVHTLIQKIVLLKDAGQRRVALRDLVARLIAADELETAVGAARLAPDLTPLSFMNNVDPFLKADLLLTVVDQLLEQQHFTRATQLLDEARLCLEDLRSYERNDLPQEEPWLQLTRRYTQAGMPARRSEIWDQAITWARALEQSSATYEHSFFQPDQGSYFLARIAEDMARYGEQDRAQLVAAAIETPEHRARALARVQALKAQSPPA